MAYGRLALWPRTLSRLNTKTRRGRGFGCGILTFLLLLSFFFKWQQINVKMWFHPTRLSNQCALNELQVSLQGSGGRDSHFLQDGLVCWVNTIISTCSTAWRTAGATAMYKPHKLSRKPIERFYFYYFQSSSLTFYQSIQDSSFIQSMY